MVTVVKVEIESQRQGAVLPFYRLTFTIEGGKVLAQSVEFGLIVCSFQDKRVFMPQKYEL